MSGEGTREDADPQLTCLLMVAPRGQQDPPHGEADRAYTQDAQLGRQEGFVILANTGMQEDMVAYK